MDIRLEGDNHGAREAKLVMIGSTTVGKTSIVNRFTREVFTNDTTSTVGASFVSKIVTVGDIPVKLQLWDTAGSEKYRSMVPIYFQNADAAIIVYDITNDQTFRDVETWFRDLQQKGPQQLTVALVGNKCDLTRMRAIDEASGREAAESFGIPIFKETSALTGDGIKELFDELSKGIIEGGATLRVRSLQIWQRQQGNQNRRSCGC